MALPTDTFTATDLAVMIPEIWGEKTNNFFRSKKVLTNWFTDRSSELANGGDTLYTPNFTEMAATAKTNAQAVTLGKTGVLYTQLKQGILKRWKSIVAPAVISKKFILAH